MTNEQAIAHFKEQLEVFGGEHHEAMKVAIEALEKQARIVEQLEAEKYRGMESLEPIKIAFNFGIIKPSTS